MIAHSSGNVHAWGTVISADTAFVVSALALIGPSTPRRPRVFLLALAVVNDIGALSIIALVYTDSFDLVLAENPIRPGRELAPGEDPGVDSGSLEPASPRAAGIAAA